MPKTQPAAATPPSPWKAYVFVALAAAWPLLNFAISNAVWLGGAPRGYLIVFAFMAAMILLAVAGLWLLVTLFGRKNLVRLAFFVAVGMLLLLSFHLVIKGAAVTLNVLHIVLSPAYAYAAVFLVAPLLALAFLSRKRFLDFGLIVAAVAVVSSAVQLGLASVDSQPAELQEQAQAQTAAAEEANYPAQAVSGTGEPLPSIYHVLADQYSRTDQLKKVLGYDNSGFDRALEERGFKVLKQARANYRETVFSVSAMHAMDYPFTEEKPLPKTLDNVFTSMGGTSAVMRKAWSLGYDYMHVDTNIWGLTQCPDHPKVICLTPRDSHLSNWDVEILDALNRMTPFSYFFSFNASMSKATSVDDVAKAVTARGFERPRVLFAHTMQPHSPYTRRADCSSLGNVSFSLSGPNDPPRYIDAVQCVNLMMLRFVDTVGAKDPNAIIILSSDHGSKFLFNTEAHKGVWTRPQFDERYSALLAIRAPKRCMDQLKDDMTLVNVYRWAFACVEGKAPDLLPDEFYNISYEALATDRKVVKFPGDGPPA
jgi:hypothetical protein